MSSSPIARDAAEGLPTSDFRQGRRVPRNVYHGDEPLFMAATEELAGELVAILNAGAAALRSAGAEGGETQGAIPDGHLCPTGETFAEEEVRDHLRAEVSDAGGVDAWAAASYVSRYGAADFLAGGPLVSHRLMNAIGFEPVTVYRPITEAGRRALHARTSDGGGA